MEILERDLVKAINSGNCFILVGSGPSNEIGLLSWNDLANHCIKLLNADKFKVHNVQLKKLLAEKDYPKIFSIVSNEVGIDELARKIQDVLENDRVDGGIYTFISNWPFACYLTTNYDNALFNHLRNIRVPVVQKLNTLEDLRTLRSNSRNTIYKIHGDPTNPDSIVLTSEQYEKFSSSDETSYWREKIRSVLHMVDLVIIGYSLSDPEFKNQLERAKEIAEPGHPVSMFASGLDKRQVKELFLDYNVRVIPYNNSDDSHSDLYKVLKRYDSFIAKRNSPNIGIEPVDLGEAELASSMYLFTQLRLIDPNMSAFVNAYAATILRILEEKTGPSQFIAQENLYSSLGEAIYSTVMPDSMGVSQAIDYLYQHSYISISDDKLKIEARGQECIRIYREERKLIEEKFIAACDLFIRSNNNLSSDDIGIIINAIEDGLIKAFRKRGIEIARSVFMEEPIDLSDATDLLEMINASCSGFEKLEIGSAFADLMIEVLLNPNREMKDYLALQSQGFFAFSALGLDAKSNSKRLNFAKDKKWILDSSVLIPMFAIGCMNYEYSKDLLDRGQKLGIHFSTTENLLIEMLEHATWAMNYIDYPISDQEMMLISAGEAGYSNNLFIEGYIKWSAKISNPSLKKYFDKCFGTHDKNRVVDLVREKLRELDIDIIIINKDPNVDQEYFENRDLVIVPKIMELRQHFGTYKSDGQCLAEAEVYLLCKDDNCQFISLSTILNQISHLNCTWRPDAFYRFITMFTTSPPDSDILYASLTQDFYSVGITIVDTSALEIFASSSIRQARMDLESESEDYLSALGKYEFNKIKEEFERIPDLQKPFYSYQLTRQVLFYEREKRKDAEQRAAKASKAKSLTESERKEFEKLKGKRAEKERKRLRKKRKKQSKK